MRIALRLGVRVRLRRTGLPTKFSAYDDAYDVRNALHSLRAATARTI